MKTKDLIKNILGTLLLTFVLGMSACLGLFVFKTDYGFVMACLCGLIIVFLIVYFCYPVWFKDYIEEYWRKYESKNMQNDDIPD